MKTFLQFQESNGEEVGGKFMSYATMKAKGIKPKKTAFGSVKSKIEKEVGRGVYTSKDNPRKPQTPADKAKVRAQQAKVDAENAAERKKDPSQGRYPKG